MKKKKSTVANPSLVAIGEGEVEVRVEPGAFDEDWVSIFGFQLQATVPRCLHSFKLNPFLYTLPHFHYK